MQTHEHGGPHKKFPRPACFRNQDRHGSTAANACPFPGLIGNISTFLYKFQLLELLFPDLPHILPDFFRPQSRLISRNVKRVQGTVLTQIQRMVGMPFLGPCPGRIPAGPLFIADADHIPQAIRQVGAFFNDRPPGGPHGGRAGPGLFQRPAECRHVFPMKHRVAISSGRVARWA